MVEPGDRAPAWPMDTSISRLLGSRGHEGTHRRALPAAWKAGAILSRLLGFVQGWSMSCPCNFGTA